MSTHRPTRTLPAAIRACLGACLGACIWACLGAALCAPLPAAAPQAERAPLLDHGRLRRDLTRFASEHADLVTRLELGSSRRELKIDALRLAAGELGRGRPAILVVANLDGPLVYTSGVALEMARDLASRYGSDASVTQLLDTTTIYFVPRANPDGAELRFRPSVIERHGTGFNVDNDRDGRSAEDHAGDVDKNGFIAWMRQRDPEGEWIVDPTDSRAMRKADRTRGERGVWKLIREGRDSDGDGEVAEDPGRDAHVNRNFPAAWEEHAPRAGLYPTHEPETRALCEFVMGHEDIQLVVVYGEQDNVAHEPKSVADDAPDKDRVPAAGVRASDATLLKEIGRRYAKIVDRKVEASDDAAGSFQAWTYGHRGLLTLSIALWSVPLDTQTGTEADAEGEGEGEDEADQEGEEADSKDDGPEPSDQAKALAWADANGVNDFHLGWTPFDHPELGPLEVGGIRPFAMSEPPASVRGELVDEQIELLLEVAPLLARVRLVDVEAEVLAGDVLRVRASVENEALLPLFTLWGRETRTTRPARVQIFPPDGMPILAGERQHLVWDLTGAGGRHEMEWLLGGTDASSVRIRVESRNAGSDVAAPEIQ